MKLRKGKSESFFSPVLRKMLIIIIKIMFCSLILYASSTVEDFQQTVSVAILESITLPQLLIHVDAKHKCYSYRATILRQVIES